MKHFSPTLLVLALLTLAGCRGMTSTKPPIHPNLNMDFSERFEEQEANPLFADNSAQRPLVAGTVARGFLRANVALEFGRTESGTYVDEIPVDVTRAFMERGQERYNIYCTPCHGEAGDGLGVIMTGNYGYVPAPTYHSEYLRGVEDGYLYEVIANGVRSMPAYGFHIPVEDRWAIVAYVRALQRSQYADATDVPADILQNISTPNTGIIQ
ncbi:MAG: cytochrome c [Bacteroidota bacterium]